MNRIACILAGLALLCVPAWSGVVIEMVETSADAADDAKIDTIYAQDGMLRMDPASRGEALSSTVVFRDDTLWLINHASRECYSIDKQGIGEVAAKIGAAMKQLEAQMAEMPPEQREAMMQMMEKRIPPGMESMMGLGEAPEPPRIEKSDTTVEVGTFSCMEHTQYTANRKDWEICTAAAGDIDDALSEAIEAFRAMSALAEKMREAFPGGPLAGRVNNPLQFMNEIDGFPVRVRAYHSGQLTRETTLKSVTPKPLGDDLFAAPDGYKVVSLTDQMQQGIRGGGR